MVETGDGLQRLGSGALPAYLMPGLVSRGAEPSGGIRYTYVMDEGFDRTVTANLLAAPLERIVGNLSLHDVRDGLAKSVYGNNNFIRSVSPTLPSNLPHDLRKDMQGLVSFLDWRPGRQVTEADMEVFHPVFSLMYAQMTLQDMKPKEMRKFAREKAGIEFDEVQVQRIKKLTKAQHSSTVKDNVNVLSNAQKAALQEATDRHLFARFEVEDSDGIVQEVRFLRSALPPGISRTSVVRATMGDILDPVSEDQIIPVHPTKFITDDLPIVSVPTLSWINYMDGGRRLASSSTGLRWNVTGLRFEQQSSLCGVAALVARSGIDISPRISKLLKPDFRRWRPEGLPRAAAGMLGTLLLDYQLQQQIIKSNISHFRELEDQAA